MIGAISGALDLGSTTFNQQLQGVNGLANLGSLTGGQGASGVAQNSATVSGPGQLLSNLQQLQTQNPAKFQQVISQIVSQLQAAAKQTQGPQSTYLSNLASKFQSVANGGSLSQLQPQQTQDLQHHHHHPRAQQAYSQAAPSQSQGVAGLAQSGNSQSSNSTTLQQLFTTISTEVSQALAG